MNITTQYGNGERVWHVTQNRKPVWRLCTFCGETGKITGKDGVKSLCPICRGLKGRQEYEGREWQVKGPLTIGQVRVQITDNTPMRRVPRFAESLQPDVGAGKSESYMCIETGVGGGIVYYPEDLFPSKVAAEEECKKRNNSGVDSPAMGGSSQP